MKVNLSFWRFVIILKIAKSLTWAKNDNLYLLHVGTITDGKNTAVRLVVLALLIDIGWISRPSK